MSDKPEELDLESYWDDIRVRSPIRLVSTQASNIKDSLTLAGEKTIFDLQKEFKKHIGQPSTIELMAEMMTLAVRTFMKHWYEDLRHQDLAGLVEIVLEGQNLTPVEMQKFVRALPQSLVERIAKSAMGTANGIHGLIGIEHAYRTGNLQDYKIIRDINDRVYVEFTDPKRKRQVQFFLDEKFDLPSD
jgi:hypothetical protein